MLVRKTVTVLFCDVAEWTGLGEQLDPESLRSVMSRYFDEMSAVLERHGATVEKFIGDAIMAVFGVPAVHEDDALRAVRAATEMRARLDEVNAELESSHGVRLQMRVGVNTGEVVAGDGTGGQRLVTGDAVNVAKRLEEAAAPGEILIGKATYPLVKDAVEVGPLQRFRPKGKSVEVDSRRLDEVGAGKAGVERRLDAPLVGREHELAQLRRLYDDVASAGRFRLVTVLGPAGIGKSRLARELLADVAAEATTVTGRCLPYGDGITFWPVVEILREAGGEQAVRAALAAGNDVGAVLERVEAVLGTSDAGASTEETFWALRRAFEALAGERPLVICLEDIHWAEPTLLDFLDYLAGWAADVPLLVVALARAELLERRPEWSAPRDNATMVTLGSLPESVADDLLDRLPAGPDLRPEARARIRAAAEGNPLFLEQMTAMAGEEAGAELTVPPTIQALLSERLDRLDREERAVVERAAVAGKQFVRGAVVELSPVDERERIGRTLRALVRKEFVRPDPSVFGADDGFRFRHVLIRDVAYEAMTKEVRADLHERYAGWLEANAGPRAAELEEIVGYHLEQAYRYREELGPLDDSERTLAARAADLLGRAGRRAFARDDMPAAVKLLDRALALATNETPARLDLLHELSGALWAVGEAARAEALLKGLVEAASAAGERRVEWYALLEIATHESVTNVGSGVEEVERVARDAIAVFESLGDHGGLARAWRRLAFGSRRRGWFGRGEEESRRALVHARRAGEGPEQARAADSLCTCLLFGPAPAAAAADECRSLLEEARGNRVMEAGVMTSLAGLEAMLGHGGESRELAARAEQIYSELGLRLGLAGLTEVAGAAELVTGNPAAAAARLRTGLAIFADVGHRRAFCAALLAQALVALGETAEAGELADFAAETAGANEILAEVAWRCARAGVEASAGHADEAVRVAREAVEVAGGSDAVNAHGDALLALARALAATGDDEAAAAAAREALARYDGKGNVAAARLAATVARRGAIVGAPSGERRTP